MKLKTFFGRILTVTLILLLISFSLFGCSKKPVEKKAIIMLPGLMGSNLYYENGNIAWALNNDFIAQPNLVETLREILMNDENNCIRVPLRPGDMNDPIPERYSYNGMFEKYYNYLSEHYGDRYDIFVWQYDWREMIDVTAQKLESMINEKGYTDIVFITHSMGGCVVTKYLDKAENRAKCNLFIAGGAPFFGSVNSASSLLSREMKSASIMDAVFNKIGIREISANIGPCYQMFPYSVFNELEVDGVKGSITINGEYKNWDSIYSQLTKIERFQKADGSAKPALLNLKNFQDMDFINVNGEMKHVTELVQTEFIIGSGLQTILTIDYNTEKDDIETVRYCDGDGTVPVYSATAGRGISDERVHTVGDIIHGSILERYISVDVLEEILSKYDL